MANGRAEELVRLVAGECTELETGRRSGALGAFERGGQTCRHLARTHGECEQHGSRRRPAQQRAEQLDRRRIAPVQIVQHEHERPVVRQQLEQLANGAITPVALVGTRDALHGVLSRQRGEHGCEVVAHIVGEPREALRLEPSQVVVECVDEDPERQVALELGGGAGEHELAALVRAAGELGEQACLADTRLANHLECGRPALGQLGESVLQTTELVDTPNQSLCTLSQFRPSRRRA